jgi:hypothetical protein
MNKVNKKIAPQEAPSGFEKFEKVDVSYFEKEGSRAIYTAQKDDLIRISLGNSMGLDLDYKTAHYLMTELKGHLEPKILANTPTTISDLVIDVDKSTIRHELEIDQTLGKAYEQKQIDDLKSKFESEIDEDDINEAQKIKQEMESFAEEMKERLDKLDPDEVIAYKKAAEKKFAELSQKKMKSIEKTLLGEIQEEAGIDYDYKYFANVYEKYGRETLREELAKLPKDRREEVINKIKQAEEQKQQQNSKTDD